jgi:hypothetical protein
MTSSMKMEMENRRLCLPYTVASFFDRVSSIFCVILLFVLFVSYAQSDIVTHMQRAHSRFNSVVITARSRNSSNTRWEVAGILYALVSA